MSLDSDRLERIVLELYRKTATELPSDVIERIESAGKKEKEETTAKKILNEIIENIKIAKEKKVPICQDTGIPVFYVEYSSESGLNEKGIRESIINATKRATNEVPLRPNAVNSLTGKNTEDNTGKHFPIIYFSQSNSDETKISLLLKGGGSENVGKRYSLPDSKLNAGRNLEGVRKCILDAVYNAQGNGCSPGVISVCIGGSKDLISFYAKKQLLERLGRKKSEPELEKLEKRILEEGNSLGIGPMGLGGNTTLLDVKIKAIERHPASYFVEVMYSCWALRRNTVIISNEGEVNYE